MFTYVIETERRFYLANKVELTRTDDGWVQVDLADAWVWDMFRPARFVVERPRDDAPRRERRGARRVATSPPRSPTDGHSVPLSEARR